MVEKEPGPSFDGIKVGPPIRKLGYRGVETVEMIYDAHRIPAGNILGEAAGRGQGLAYILTALEWGRLNIAARAVGVARSALDAALKYAGQRRTFGVTIDQHQAIQFKLADMATKIAAARALTIHAARLIGSGMRTDVEAAMAKLFASEVAAEVSLEAMRIHGGYGYTEEFAVERYYRDAPLLLIGEGTNEIQRLVIARGLLKQRDAANPTLLQSS
jgi:alkylation response protein AidB-like acyl-CoA dehydrogenase